MIFTIFFFFSWLMNICSLTIFTLMIFFVSQYLWVLSSLFTSLMLRYSLIYVIVESKLTLHFDERYQYYLWILWVQLLWKKNYFIIMRSFINNQLFHIWVDFINVFFARYGRLCFYSYKNRSFLIHEELYLINEVKNKYFLSPLLSWIVKID